MSRKSLLIVGGVVVLLVGGYFGASAYTMNASFSVADPQHGEYYARYARIWGITTLLCLAGALGLAVFAWRLRKE